MRGDKPWVGVRAARIAKRLIADERYRNSALVRLARPVRLFQPDNHTEFDRYPALFELVAQLIVDSPDRHLLSFGCSTGEEVFSLRGYFPAARITGIDINPANIAVCRRRLAERPDPRIDFSCAGTVDALGVYDAVFCMAVFRHGGLADSVTERCDHLIRFESFRQVISGLARSLKVGGLLILEHSNFRFEDTPSYGEFEGVGALPTVPDGYRTPVYGPDNRLVTGFINREVVFRKRASA